jgi:hypothetical protein
MGIFKSQKQIPIGYRSLHNVANDLMLHFRAKDFEVAGEETLSGGWEISIYKGGTLKALLGLKTALKINIEPANNGTLVKAGVGIFGQQVVPSIFTLLLKPLAVTQVWGIIKQARLDNEAIQVVERSLSARASAVRNAGDAQYCTSCGTEARPTAKFCDGCGSPQSFEAFPPGAPPTPVTPQS